MGNAVQLDRRDHLFLGLITALPLLGYQFGLGNQVEQFAIIERFADPTFLRGDFYVDSASAFGPRYYYTLLLSLLIKAAPLPLLILILSCVTNYAVARITFVATRGWFGASAAGAALAAALAITNSSFSFGLVPYLRYESFQPASIAIPFSLLGFLWLVDGRRYAAAGLFLVSALFHPLIGAETAMIAYLSCAVAELAAGRPVVDLVKYAPSGALFAAAFALAWIAPGLSGQKTHLSSEEFFAILPAFRAPHHYLALTFPALHYRSLAAFVAAITGLFFMLRRSEAQTFARAAFAAAVVIILVLCAASVVCVDLAHDRLWATAQIYRELFLLKWIGFAFFGAVASAWLQKGRPLAVVAAIAVLVATGEAHAFVMLAAFVAVVAADRMKASKRIEVGIAFGLIIFAAVVTLDIGVRQEVVRTALAAFSLGALYLAPIGANAAIGVSTAVIAAAVLFGAVNSRLDLVDVAAFRPIYRWSDLEANDADIARWINANTSKDGIWITPPEFESFRLVARRPIVVDFTSIPFDEAAMREWRRRIDVLYGPVSGGGFRALRAMDRNYRKIEPDALARRSREFNAGYAVLYVEGPWNGPVLYRNAEYKAVRIVARPAE